MLASLNNVVIGLVAHVGEKNLAEAQRGFAYRFDKAMHYHNSSRVQTQPTATAQAPAAAQEDKVIPLKVAQRKAA